MSRYTSPKPIRWAVLIVTLLNTLFNGLSEYLMRDIPSVKEMSDRYSTLFTPAGYAFSIWGIIYLSFIIYAIYQLLPVQRLNPLYDKLAGPIISINVMAALWIVIFTNHYIIPSVFIILCMLALGAMLYSIVNTRKKRNTFWIKFPFRVFLGWITVATIANISLCLKFLHFDPETIGIDETHWTIILVIFTCVIALSVSYRFKDLIYPLVICWACVGIAIANIHKDQTVSTWGFIAGALLFIWILNSIMFYYVSHKPLPHSEGKTPQPAG
jgi:translocator protein